MKREILTGYRVRDKQPIEVALLTPETPEDEAEIERLDQRGLLVRGGTFDEQREHAHLAGKRRRKHAAARTRS